MNSIDSTLKLAMVIAIVAAVAQIILFFKIWRMTNDVHSFYKMIKEHLYPNGLYAAGSIAYSKYFQQNVKILSYNIEKGTYTFCLLGKEDSVHETKENDIVRRKKDLTVEDKVGQFFCTADTDEDKPATKDNKIDIQKVKKGDKVIRISDGEIITVEDIGNGKLFCNTGSLSGYKWFNLDEVKTV